MRWSRHCGVKSRRESEIWLAQGGTTANACRRLSISEPLFPERGLQHSGIAEDPDLYSDLYDPQ